MSILSKTVEDVGRDGRKVTRRIISALDDADKALERIFDNLTIGLRGLRGQERYVLSHVYQGALPPLENILVISLVGMGDRPFTVPASMFAYVAYLLMPEAVFLTAALAGLIGKRFDRYVMFMGKDGYNNTLQMARDTGNDKFGNPLRLGQTLVHEACHVWQGYHQLFTWQYIFNSIYNQCIVGGAYNLPYPLSKQWTDYGAEQQAVIVETWFQYGGLTSAAQAVVANYPTITGDTYDASVITDALTYYPYVHCNVRPAQPYADTSFPAT